MRYFIETVENEFPSLCGSFEELLEAPLGALELHGDTEDEGSFRASDLRAIKNPSWQIKARNAFSRTPFVFNVYMYNGIKGHVKFGENPPVNARLLRHIAAGYTGEMKIGMVEDLVGAPIDSNGTITALLLENEGDGRLPLTAWMLGHRICHAILLSNIGDTFHSGVQGYCGDIAAALRSVPAYKKKLDAASGRGIYPLIGVVASLIGTMRSARTGEITSRVSEFTVELLTQYIVSGKITFARIHENYKEGGPSARAVQRVNAMIEEAEDYLNAQARDIFRSCLGKAYVL